MRFARYLILAAAVAVFSGVALADAIDPAIGVKGGTGSELWTGAATFFIANGQPGSSNCDSTCDFQSQTFFTNTPLTSFDLIFDIVQGPFSPAEDSAFPIVETIVPGFVARMSGGTIFPPCDGEECFAGPTQIFGDFVFVMQGVVDGSTVVVSSTPVPEPGTMMLLGSGLAAMGLRRLRRNKAAATSVS
jgi:hypothetical protein